MATRYTPNLRLRIEDDLTADAIYNLQRLDELGAIVKLGTTSSVEVVSSDYVQIQPNSPTVGGSGVGGLVRVGSSAQVIDLLDVYAKRISFVGLDEFNLDSANLTGNFSISWDRIDTNGASTAAFGDFETAAANVPAIASAIDHVTREDNPHSVTASQVGAYSKTEADDLFVARSNIAALEAHVAASSGVHGLAGAVVGTTDAQTLVNKTISASNNQLSDIKNAAIAADASIHGSKIRPLFGNQQVQTVGLRLDGASQYVILQPSDAIQTMPLTFKLPSSYGASGQVLATDGYGNLSWQNSAGSAISQEAYYWYDSDGIEKVITHGFNSQNLDITIRDLVDNELIYVPDINIVDNSTIILISSEAPSNAWQVIIQGVTR